MLTVSEFVQSSYFFYEYIYTTSRPGIFTTDAGLICSNIKATEEDIRGLDLYTRTPHGVPMVNLVKYTNLIDAVDFDWLVENRPKTFKIAFRRFHPMEVYDKMHSPHKKTILFTYCKNPPLELLDESVAAAYCANSNLTLDGLVCCGIDHYAAMLANPTLTPAILSKYLRGVPLEGGKLEAHIVFRHARDPLEFVDLLAHQFTHQDNDGNTPLHYYWLDHEVWLPADHEAYSITNRRNRTPLYYQIKHSKCDVIVGDLDAGKPPASEILQATHRFNKLLFRAGAAIMKGKTTNALRTVLDYASRTKLAVKSFFGFLINIVQFLPGAHIDKTTARFLPSHVKKIIMWALTTRLPKDVILLIISKVAGN